MRLQVDTVSGVAVPHEAIQHGQDGLFVFAIKPDETVERRPVDVLYDDGQQSVLSKGLDPDAQVVVAGQARIGSGTKVAFKRDGAGPGQPQQSAER